MKPAALIPFAGAALLAGCFNPQFQQGVPCTEDRQCPEGQICHTDDRCYDPDQIPVACTEGFIECTDDTTARVCDADGNEVDVDCGAAGCSPDSGCGECVADTAICDGNVLERCGADGTLAGRDTCAAGCVDGTATVNAHCAYLSPTYLPDICDTPATEDIFVVDSTGTIDTSLDSNCNGGVITQVGGPEICVFRYGAYRIEPSGSLKVIGSRALAIVVDESLEILGTLDVAAEGSTHGPGGGTISSGESPTDETGGGGAGFSQPGAAGGSTVAGGGGTGGDTVDPLSLSALIGGPRGGSRFIAPNLFSGGGGGGALTLIACRGVVTIGTEGIIDAGGGGGQGGGQGDGAMGTTTQHGGRGGGAGGQVVIQGLDVQIQGQVFANGGGGGGGGADTTSGQRGFNGPRARESADGGDGVGAAGNGGRGGSTVFPSVGSGHGAGEVSAGGGGGSAGFFRVVVPDGATPTLTPSESSPMLSSPEVATTR